MGEANTKAQLEATIHAYMKQSKKRKARISELEAELAAERIAHEDLQRTASGYADALNDVDVENTRLRKALEPIRQEIKSKVEGLHDEDWNPECQHSNFSLLHRECVAIDKALAEAKND